MKRTAPETYQFPVAVLDSGIGGLSLLVELRELLPKENYIYFADFLCVPYGIKSKRQISRQVSTITQQLYEKGIKAVTLACNTATSAAVADLRRTFPISIIGMEPALKPAVEISQTGLIAVLATPLTLREEKYSALARRFKSEKKIIPVPCGELVSCIENEDYLSPSIAAKLQSLLEPTLNAGADVIVLGCTHFNFLISALKSFIPAHVKILDGNKGTARQLKKILQENQILNRQNEAGKIQFLGSGDHPEEKLLGCWKKALSLPRADPGPKQSCS